MKMIFELDNAGACGQLEVLRGYSGREYAFFRDAQSKGGFKYLFDGTRDQFSAMQKDLCYVLNKRNASIWIWPGEEVEPLKARISDLEAQVAAGEAMIHELTKPKGKESVTGLPVSEEATVKDSLTVPRKRRAYTRKAKPVTE